MTKALLEILKNTDGFVSGADLAEQFQVSRAAVWKNINKLKAQGYQIESVSNRGYRLDQKADLLNEMEIAQGLKTVHFGKRIFCLEALPSTNEYIKTIAMTDVPEGTVVVADTQTKGKGRLGRLWSSEKGTTIAMSILLRPNIPPEVLGQLSLLTGLVVSNAITSVTGLSCQIKWPNDILVEHKKVSGILLELSAEMMNINYLVIGIGINVNNTMFEEEIAHRATSLKLATGTAFSRVTLIQKVLEEFENAYFLYMEEGFQPFLEMYKSRCVNLYREVKVLEKNDQWVGRAVDIVPEGHMVIEKADGSRCIVSSNEVSVRGIDGNYC